MLKRVKAMFLGLVILLSSIPFTGVQAFYSPYTLTVTSDLTNWVLDESGQMLYGISESGKNLVFINTSTMKVDKTISFTASPTDIIIDEGKLYIALDKIQKIIVVDTATKAIEQTLNTTSDPYRLVKDGNNLFYTEYDQWCDVYQYDLTSSQETQLQIPWTYQPDLAINTKDHMLYIGESSSSGCKMYYYSITEQKVVSTSNYDDGYGYPDTYRYIQFDGQQVYYAGFAFDPADATNMLGGYSYTQYNRNDDVKFAKNGYVFVYNGIYSSTNYNRLNTYNVGFDLYECSKEPIFYFYSKAKKQVVKLDPQHIQYEVKFNTNGGSKINNIIANPGAYIKQPTNPTRSGYYFGGWYKNSNYSAKWNFATDKVNNDTTIYAKWIQKVYKTTKASAKSYDYKSVKISGYGESGASAYEIYRSTSKTGKYKLVKTVKTTSYVDSGLSYGKSYYYKVKATQVYNGKKYSSDYSNIVSAKPTLSTPTHLQFYTLSDSELEVTWDKVSGASGYMIYRQAGISGKFKMIKKVTSPSYYFTSDGMVRNQYYYYKVVAYRKVGSKTYYSKSSELFYAVFSGY